MKNTMFASCANEDMKDMYKRMSEENVFADYIEGVRKENPNKLYTECVSMVYNAFVEEVCRRFFA